MPIFSSAGAASHMAATLVDTPAASAPESVRPFVESLAAHVGQGTMD
jgi:hypothetical protein